MIETLLFVYLHGMWVTFLAFCLVNAWQNTDNVVNLMAGLVCTLAYTVAWPLLFLWLCASGVKKIIGVSKS